MYVKGLTLKGFKSFADPVSLDLQPGVNVVVGPNGSGKSNVIDAVAWVLGAQGARALRGGKMDDVIFAGTGRRPALGRAEVSLTIDNGDHRLPVDFSEVTITRTLFRTGESEYAINGVSCRLLDIQELLSDSGVGRQQHVIVSQGNLDAVLSARPEDRRMIVEEAAGVLKYRKRRERSQRRLESTEENLERLQDLVREVRQQMRPLQKQAEAASRHDEVAAELRALRLYTGGREIESLRNRQGAAESENEAMARREHELRAELQIVDAQVDEAEAVTAEFRGDRLGEQVERLESLFQRAKGIGALMVERRRSLERDLASSVSQDVVASLESDSVNVRRELARVEDERQQLPAPFEELGHGEAVLGSEWIAFEEEWGEGLPRGSNEAAELRGEAGALRKSVHSLEDDLGSRRARVERLRAECAVAESDAESAETLRQGALSQKAVLEREAQVTTERAEDARIQLDSARTGLREVGERRSVAAARVEALASALDAARAKAGVERLGDVGGVAGTLLELVDVEAGYQAAFEAAVGEAMSAVVVDSPEIARDALDHLREGDGDGAVLALGLVGADEHSSLPGGVDSLRGHVRGNSATVDRLLDRLLRNAVVVSGDWRSALDEAVALPELVVVTRGGDRFSSTSWRIGNGAAGVTSAALQAARRDLAVTEDEWQRCETAEQNARSTHASAHAEMEAALDALEQNESRLTAAVASLQSARGRVDALTNEIETIAAHVATLSARHDTEQSRLSELDARLPELEAAEANSAERARQWREARRVLEARSADLRARRSELEVKSKSLDERWHFLTDRLRHLDARLEQHRIEVERATERRETLERAVLVISSLKASIDERIADIEGRLTDVRDLRNKERERQQTFTARLEAVRRRKSAIERELLEGADRRQQHEVRLAELRLRLEAVIETLESELEVIPDEALAAPQPDLPSGQTPKQRITELDRELRQMGPINPLALDEFNAVKERHEFLDKQIQDVQASRRDLVRVIRAVDSEIVETFRGAYDDVARNFAELFGMLFPGGAGNLRLTDPDNLLETGIEIEAKPSGKNVRTLSLLSGGERSLAAMAFLFAVFRSRPSPFYLLDEVEAALDDVNLSRFLMLVQEFRGEAQLVIVTHQKRTMEVADCLYGVSMQSGGSSKVVSERVHIDLTKQSA